MCWHGGITLTLAELTGLLVGEQLMHGYDIAAATGIPWSISVDDAALAFVGYRAVLLRTVDPDGAHGHTATYRVDLGVAGRLTVRFTDGVVALVPAYRGPVDCEITADPVAMLLVATGRLPRPARSRSACSGPVARDPNWLSATAGCSARSERGDADGQ